MEGTVLNSPPLHSASPRAADICRRGNDAAPSRSGFTFQPGLQRLSSLVRRRPADFLAQAVDREELATPGVLTVKPAKMLPGQLDRIRGTEFGTSEQVIRDFIGGFETMVPGTFAYRFKNVLLVDGVLYNRDAAWHLRPRTSMRPVYRKPSYVARASIYESWTGNRWFGNWLGEDCLTYLLTERTGSPIRTMPAEGHKQEYHRRAGMKATFLPCAVIDDLVLLTDAAHNEGKRARGIELRKRLIGIEPDRHPGVFLLRGNSGERRVLRNERAIADHLATRYGFRIVDPLAESVEEIIAACAGAQVVAGVEGSQLVHGLMVMPPDARALVIQPPTRVVSVLKLWVDRQGQDYAVVIGSGNHDVFDADIREIELTLDLA
jgi:hypothetical protein